MATTLQIEQKVTEIIVELSEQEKLLQELKEEYGISGAMLEKMKRKHKTSLELMEVYFLEGIITGDWSGVETFILSLIYS
jgi:hypothetical protein